jgi:hypothetical protein
LKFFHSKRAWVTLVLVLLVLYFVRPGSRQIRNRIASSISLALGRPVEMTSASIRLLPYPGFELQGFVVHDDPAFSAEPMLRAEDVTASIRLWSLLHGRLEISRLSLSDPSLNLVRDVSGHWNLEELLQRAAQTSVAPTAKARTELRPAFPYIEADGGRVNLKFGEEKKPYTVTDADFSLWQDSENSWGLRLEGRPVRTDFNLTNTGTIKLSGTWQRAATLRETPLQFTLQWENGQLGQITMLGDGNDEGWRGGLTLVTQINGNPDDLHIQANAAIQNFRHYDVSVDSDFPFSAQCDAQFNSADQSLHEIHCQLPFQSGMLLMDGNIESLLGPRKYALSFAAENIPMQSVADLAARVKKNFPQSLTATGQLNAKVGLTTDKAANPNWQGQGEITNTRLESAGGTGLVLGIVPFTIQQPLSPKTYKRAPSLSAVPSGPTVEIGPFNLHLGPGSTLVHGWLSASNYELRLQGNAQIQHLLQAAQVLGIPAPQTTADGSASMDLNIGGQWTEVSAARTTGTAQLHSVRAQINGLDAPLVIETANLSLSSDQVKVQKLVATIAGSAWRGTLSLPRPCAIQETCAAHFNLHADQLTAAQLDLLLASSHKTRWYSLLTENQTPTFLSKLRATGSLLVEKITLHKLVAAEFFANVNLNAGSLDLLDARAKLLGGRHTGDLTINFAASQPSIQANGNFDDVDLQKLSSLTGDDWITGTADATYHFSGTGRNVESIFSSSSAELQIDARTCELSHITLGQDDPLRMQRFYGDLLFSNGNFQLKQGSFDSSDGKYELTGTASLSRDINFKLTRSDGPEFNIDGSLSQPRVVASKNRIARISQP